MREAVGGAPARVRVVVLVSGSGTNLQALLDASRDPAYPAEVVAVGADRDGIAGLRRATAHGVPTFVCRVEDHLDRGAWDAELARRIEAHRPALVISAGFMKLLGPRVLAGVPVVNTHPALLPAFPGAHAVRDALGHGARVSGVTVHYVDAGVDTGPVIAQRAVVVEPGDTEESLHERIKTIERPLLVDVVAAWARGELPSSARRVSMT